MKNRYVLIIFVLFLTANTKAQQTINVSGKAGLIPNLPNLTLGDSLPDFQIPKLINTNKSIIRTSEFKEKLLIIDFWSIYCSGCIEGLPKMHALQQQFGDKIKILPVTYESETLVSNFWRSNKNTKKLSLSSVVEDKIFSSYFRHQTIPHEVWIYKGKVVGITNAQYVDENNIKKVLNHETLNWPVKNDFYSFDGTKQAIFQLNPNQIDINHPNIKYAAISEYKEGVNSDGLTGGSGIVRNPTQKTVRAFFLNQPVYTTYLLNWAKVINTAQLIRPTKGNTPNQIVWEVADKAKYIYDSKKAYQAEWIRANGICFESLNPDTGQTDATVAKSIITDLDALLNLHVRWEKRKEKVLVLVRTIKEDKLKSQPVSKLNKDQLTTMAGDKNELKSVPISTLIYLLNQQAENPYVFDETGYKDNVNLILNISSWTAIASIRQALSHYGLDLKEEEKIVDKFILTE